MTEPEIKDLLKQYPICKRFIDSQAYAKEYFNPHDVQQIDEKEAYEARMHAIESLIKFLAPSDEYTILYLHYIKGIPVKKCADCMYFSRRTAFRMLENAYKKICEFVNKKGAGNEQN